MNIYYYYYLLMVFLLEKLFYRSTNVLKEALSLSLPTVKVLSSDNSHSRSLLPVLVFLSPLTEGAVCIPCQSFEELSVISHSFLKSVTRLRELKKDYYFMYPAYFTVQKNVYSKLMDPHIFQTYIFCFFLLRHYQFLKFNFRI